MEYPERPLFLRPPLDGRLLIQIWVWIQAVIESNILRPEAKKKYQKKKKFQPKSTKWLKKMDGKDFRERLGL